MEQTPLYECHNPEIIKLLLNHGCNINHVDCRGSTPLHILSLYGYKESIIALLENGANPDIRNRDGKIAIDMTRHDEIKNIIQSYFPEIKEPDVEKIDFLILD